MKVTSVRVGYSRTWNTRQYESAKVEAEFAGEVEETEDPTAICRALFDAAKAEVRIASVPILAERKKRDLAMARSIFAGLPKDLQGEFANFIQSHMNDVKVEDVTNGHQGVDGSGGATVADHR